MSTLAARMEQTPAILPDLSGLVEIIRTIVFAPGAAIGADTRLGDLGLDSLDLMDAAMELETVLQRDLPDAAFNPACTVSDILFLLHGDRVYGEQLSLRLAA